MNATQNSNDNTIKLTEYSKGAGCGCKIAPQKLQEILKDISSAPSGSLLVGNSHRDDAAVIDLGNGTSLISTTDFFTPIVDDPFAFGKIAAANAVSDVYAMGGKPLVAIAILGWPEEISATHAQKVMAGGREVCNVAGIPLAGGHSIESREPFFGLAVNGIIHTKNLKRNNTAEAGDSIFLTKPLGSGILSTAQKRKVIDEKDIQFLTDELCKLNLVGAAMGRFKEVSAMTDVTGFGLAGHLSEMAEGSGLSAIIGFRQLPIYANAKKYLEQKIVPDATYRNWNACGNEIEIDKGIDFMQAFGVLADPQTNGGLLIAVHQDGIGKIQTLLKENGLEEFAIPIGRFVEKQKKTIIIKPSL